MPHVIVKLWPGKSESQKARLAEEIAKDVMDVHSWDLKSPAFRRPLPVRRSDRRISGDTDRRDDHAAGLAFSAGRG
jgi:hypothetical protein